MSSPSQCFAIVARSVPSLQARADVGTGGNNRNSYRRPYVLADGFQEIGDDLATPAQESTELGVERESRPATALPYRPGPSPRCSYSRARRPLSRRAMLAKIDARISGARHAGIAKAKAEKDVHPRIAGRSGRTHGGSRARRAGTRASPAPTPPDRSVRRDRRTAARHIPAPPAAPGTGCSMPGLPRRCAPPCPDGRNRGACCAAVPSSHTRDAVPPRSDRPARPRPSSPGTPLAASGRTPCAV